MKKMKDVMKRQDSNMGMSTINRFDDAITELYRMMDGFWNSNSINSDVFSYLQPKTSFPKVNVAETDDAYEVEIAVSGFGKDSVDLEFKDSCLFIKVDKNEEKEDEGKKWLTREISSRAFRRVIQFPSEVLVEDIKSKYDENRGIIACSLPKKIREVDKIVKIKID
jgi:HSP20 family protein